MSVLFLFEIREDVGPSSGEENLAGVSRVLTIQRSVEQRWKVDIPIARYGLSGPFGDRVVHCLRLPGQSWSVEVMKLVIQRGNQFEVMRQRAELCRASEFQLHALVEIERLVERVGLNPEYITGRGSLEQSEAVGDPRGITSRQQVFLPQTLGFDEGRILHFSEEPQDLVLYVNIQRRVGLQVEPVQRIKIGDTQLGEQMGAERVGRLSFDKRDGLGRGGMRQKFERDGCDLSGEIGRDGAITFELTYIEINPGFQGCRDLFPDKRTAHGRRR